jgi:hypothetical protein
MASTYEHELEALHEFELENEFEGLGELEHELEFELEAASASGFQGEFEFEHEVNPVRKIYGDSMMEHLAHVAAEAESEHEAAEYFLPLVGMAAAKLLPLAAKAAAPALKKALPRLLGSVTRVQPQLTKGITAVVKALHRRPETRRLIHAVPTIARRTIGTIARQATHGRPITPNSAVRALAHQTRRVLLNRPLRTHVLRRSHMLDRRFHRHMGPHRLRPHYSQRWWSYGGRPGIAGAAGMPGLPPAMAAGPGSVAARGRGVMSAGGWRPAVAGMCPPCSCGGATNAQAIPSYCRCCGQILR